MTTEPIINRENITIALDVMGGDNDPNSMINAACEVLKKRNIISLKFLLFGNQELINSEIDKQFLEHENIEIVHTESVVGSNETPSFALRNGRKSSMRLAIDAVKVGHADAVVSSGNTGALMAMSKIVLRTLLGVDRPAICGIIPTLQKSAVMLDMGANVECSANNLVQFAVMGAAFASAALQIKQPKIGLLNIGSEDIKGSDAVKQAAQILKKLEHQEFDYYGFVEGDDLTKSVVDVIVADGFSGNIALKTAEGITAFCRDLLKKGFNSSMMAKIGYLMAKTSIKKSFEVLDHRRYNGAMLLGLDGIVVKSHGSSDKIANINAIETAINLVKNRINNVISDLIEENFADSIIID